MNCEAAANAINNNGLSSIIRELVLNPGETITVDVKALGGTTPLMASISWTDVPGVANNSLIVNDLTRALVNDLDIRITKDGTTYYPWKLQTDPNNLATRVDDNDVDNVEQIKIDNPSAGEYLVSVTHKGNLVNGNQNFSLVVTGVSSNFSKKRLHPIENEVKIHTGLDITAKMCFFLR